MTASQFVPVVPGTIGNLHCLTVDGRTLHNVLGVRRDFSTWMKGRIEKYGFVQGQDFEVFFPKTGENSELDSPNLGNQKKHGGDRRSMEYCLTVGMGKELCMVENNEKGRIARRYFIECERRLLESLSPEQPATTLSPADRAELKALVDAKLSTADAAVQGRARAEIWTRFNRHFKIAEYAQLPVRRMAEARDYIIAMRVKALRPLPSPASRALADDMVLPPAAQKAADSLHENMEAIRLLVRRIRDHEDALFGAARNAVLPRNTGGLWTAAIWTLDTMHANLGAIDRNLETLEASARVLLALRAA